MKTFQLYICLVVLVLSMHVSAYSQQDTTIREQPSHPIALIVQVTSGFSLHSFEGQLISLRKLVDNNHAWRFGVTIYGRHQWDDEVTWNFKSDFNLGTTISKVTYINTDSDLRGYYGLGLRALYQHSWNPNRRDEQVTFGPIAYLGAECIISQKISLSVEYGGQIFYSIYYEKDMTGFSERSNTDHAYGIVSDNVRFGLSVSF